MQNPKGGITFSAYKQIFNKPPTGQIGFTTALVYSLELAAITIVITMALMLPTQLLLHLRLPRWRGLVEIIPQSGTYVFTPTPAMITELSEFRFLLEESALRRAMEHNSTALLGDMRNVIAAMQSAWASSSTAR